MNRFQDTTPAKLRGGYYTSSQISEVLCNWAIRKPTDLILEPSCGDGVFIEHAVKRLLRLRQQPTAIANQIKGIEMVEAEIQKAGNRVEAVIGSGFAKSLECCDYFVWYKENSAKLFDCAVGNPPFIRYQNFPEPSRSHAMTVLVSLGMKPNKLTNIWVPFVASATSQLKPGGRLAMVIPAELLQVSYASQLREFLTRQFDLIEILACNEMIFENAEQEVVLLLADGKTQKAKGDHSCRIDLIEEQNIADLLPRIQNTDRNNDDAKIVHHDKEKWLKYFLSSSEILLMRELRTAERITSLRSHAAVDIGVVTGKNEFFVLSKEQVQQYGLEKYALPLVGRSSQLKGADLTKQEWVALVQGGQRMYLFYVNQAANGSLSQAAKVYIKRGEALHFHSNYKCSIRDPWYIVPSVWSPDCFLFRQIYDFPRIVKNSVKATSTDTIHRMRCKKSADLVASNAYTHLTAASAEIEGRSYGGGVLELEPSESEKLLFPKQLHEALPLKDIDKLIRSGQLQRVLDENDRLVLMNGIGLSKKDCAMLKNIWTKMRDRRRSRRRFSRTVEPGNEGLFHVA